MEKQTPTLPPPTPSPSSKPTTKRSLMPSLTQAIKEDTYLTSTLKPTQLKSLNDLKTLLLSPSSPSFTLWGIPLTPTPNPSPSTDVILLKFLRARDFSPTQAHSMLLQTLQWRHHFKADTILDEDIDHFKDLEGVVAYMHGWDRSNHPVCYNAYGIFKSKNIYDRVFGDEIKLGKFLRWRVQVMERGIKMLQFTPGGVNSIIQVTDLKDMPKRELRVASNHILSLFQDNYPEMVATKVFINVPWYFSMLYAVISPFLTERTKSKFVMAKEGNVVETLYK